MAVLALNTKASNLWSPNMASLAGTASTQGARAGSTVEDVFTTPKISSLASGTRFPKPDWSAANGGLNRWGDPVLTVAVATGDTLGTIARQLGTDVATLASLNGLGESDHLDPGQRLELPLTFHVATEGETYASIAERTGVHPSELRALNAATSDGLEPGQRVHVPAAIASAEELKTRRELMGLFADAAEADSRLIWGPGQVEATSRGNAFEWKIGRYLFSDDYRHVVRRREPEERELSPLPLRSPVEGTRIALVTGALSYAARFVDIHAKYAEEAVLPDGRFKLTVYDRAGDTRQFFYDPSDDGLTELTRDGVSIWIGRVTMPTQAIETFARYVGMKIPFFD